MTAQETGFTALPQAREEGWSAVLNAREACVQHQGVWAISDPLQDASEGTGCRMPQGDFPTLVLPYLGLAR
jgi:hypothetical protein